jgi:hypothetical protein
MSSEIRQVSAAAARSAKGRRSRNKGKAFELVVRDQFKIVLPHVANLTIRRSLQAERAWDADLIVEGDGNLPAWLLSLWLECEHANDPDPKVKLIQARRDVERFIARTSRRRLPLVVWRKTHSRSVYASTDLATLLELLGQDVPREMLGSGSLVTMLLTELLATLMDRP